MSHVFVSYARKDIGQAGRIIEALAAHNQETWIDWKSIPKGEDWEQEIYRGIEKADAFLLLVSPSSVRSQMCNKEIACAVEFGKRIIPIFISNEEVGEVNKNFHTRRAGEEIMRRNYVFCREGQDDFDRAIRETLQTIHTDYQWLRDHTQLLGSALAWGRSSDSSRLLTGRALADAESQISKADREKLDPYPTLIMYQYVNASRMEADRTRQARHRIRNLVTIVIAVLAVLAGLLALGQYEQKQAALAGELAARSQAELNQYPQRSLLLAAEALNISKVPAANEALLHAMTHISGEGLDVRQGYVTAVALSRDGRWAAVTASDGAIHLFDLEATDHKATILVGSDDTVFSILSFSANGKWLAASSGDTKVLTWNFSKDGITTQPSSLTLDSPITALFFETASESLVVGCQSGAPLRIPLNDPTAVPKRLAGDDVSLSELVMSPNGVWLAGSGANGGILLWNLGKPDLSAERLGDSSFITTLAFSPDGRRLGTGATDGLIQVWDLEQIEALPVSLKEQSKAISHLEFGQNGNLLASSQGAVAQLWDLNHGTVTRLPSASSAEITQLFLLDEDSWLITTAMDGTLERWDLSSDRPQDSSRVAYGHDGAILMAAISADDSRLITGSDDNTARLWNLEKLWDEDAFLVVLPGHTGEITSLVISSDSRWLASGSADQTIRLWDLTDPSPSQVPQILRLHEGDVKKLAFSPDGRWLMSSGGDVMRLWNLSTEPPTPDVIASHNGEVVDILFSPNGSYALSASNPLTADGVVNQWDLGVKDIAGSRSMKWSTTGMSSSLAFSPDGKWLAIGCGFYAPLTSTSVVPCATHLVDRHDGKEIRLPLEDSVDESSISTDTYTRVVFSPDSHWLISTSDSIAAVFDVTAQDVGQSGFALSEGSVSLVGAVYPGKSTILDIRFSPDGTWLATQEKPNVIRLWRTEDLRGEPVVLTTAEAVQAIAFAPDNLHLIAGDETGSVYAWHLKDAAAAPSVFRDHSTAITALTVSPDGRWLVTGSRDQSVRLRSMEYLDAGSLQDIVCAKAGRNLTQMEWQQYLGDSSVQAVCPGWPQEHTRVNDVQETWRWKFAPAIAGFLKSGLLYCLGTIFSLFVVWLGYELYERAARWWRDRST